ncbi:hypothetical protein ACHAXR_012893 [Thalassiosira sp. AJA248-18]
MPGTRGKGQPDREIYNLFATLNQEQQREKHDISGLYEGRLRSHGQAFEGLKRKWEGFTGVPVPKKLRTSEPDGASVENGVLNQPNTAELNQTHAAKTVTKTVRKTKAISAPAPIPPHPDDKIDVANMIVNELRKELKKRNLSTSGRKAELQARLREYLEEAKQKREAEWAAKHAVEEAETQIKRVKISDGGADQMDVVMEDTNEADVSLINDSNKAELTKKAPVAKMASIKAKDALVESQPMTKEATVGAVKINYQSAKQAPKSALKPSKYTSSNAQSTPQLDDAKQAKTFPSSLAKEDLPAPKQILATKVSDSSLESSNNHSVASYPTTVKSAKLQSSVQKTKAISSTLAQTTPGGSAFKTKAGGAGSAKLLEKKKAHAAASEARKARMAEMRQKAKPTVAGAGSATKPPSSHSKYAVSSTLKKMASSSTLGESKPNSILAKMREKAAAEKNTENTVKTLPTKPSPAIKHAKMVPSSPTVKRVSKVVTSQPALKSTALKSILDPANKPSPVPEIAKPEATKPQEKPLSPMQTYEMSDREEDSDSESDSDEEYERQRPKKAVPEWAQKSNLHRALERQFADGPNRLDPDKIFGEVLTCNLEDIFDKKKSRYVRRTSSGNWTKDHVTIAEKLTYKRTMGYDKK